MFDSLKRLYLAGKIDAAKLDVAVSKGWITTDEGVLEAVRMFLNPYDLSDWLPNTFIAYRNIISAG